MDEAALNITRMREYVTPDGVRWQRRGDQVLTGRSLGTRLRRSGLRVLHSYLDDVTLIPPDQRAGFWADAETRMAASPHSDFIGVEFRNDSGDYLLVVEEYC
jgi:hypothetical protein